MFQRAFVKHMCIGVYIPKEIKKFQLKVTEKRKVFVGEYVVSNEVLSLLWFIQEISAARFYLDGIIFACDPIWYQIG